MRPSLIQAEASLPETATKVLVLLNPKAGARSGFALAHRLTESLTAIGFQTELMTEIGQMTESATAKMQQQTLRAVVAAGGDGTLSLVAHHTPPGTPLLVIPLGTENLMARFLGIRPDVPRICQIIREGAVVRLDAGRANGRLFLLMAGCGFDAEVVRRLHESRRGHIRHLSYVKPILASIRSYEYPELRIYSSLADGAMPTQPSLCARWAFVVNLPCYAGGLTTVPAAVGDDGLLDVCTFKRGSFWHGLRYVASVAMGVHQRLDDCVSLQARRLRIESDAEVPYQLDGDPGGLLPAEIEVLPRRLTLLVPRKSQPPAPGTPNLKPRT
jgi:YegS/Rv2252/BmrU family lipid kinase